MNGEEKFTAPAKGKDAAIDETLEFILGRKEIQGHSQLSVDIEVWDYRLINHFKVRNTARTPSTCWNFDDNHYYQYCCPKCHCDCYPVKVGNNPNNVCLSVHSCASMLDRCQSCALVQLKSMLHSNMFLYKHMDVQVHNRDA